MLQFANYKGYGYKANLISTIVDLCCHNRII